MIHILPFVIGVFAFWLSMAFTRINFEVGFEIWRTQKDSVTGILVASVGVFGGILFAIVAGACFLAAFN